MIIKEQAVEALSKVLENLVRGSDADCIISEFKQELDNLNRKQSKKNMCLKNKTKICNLCHDCDVYVLNPNY